MKYMTEQMMATEELEDFSRQTIDKFGYIHFFDKEGRYHREDGPAFISQDGHCEVWYNHGLSHREGGPASSSPVTLIYMRNGRYHRDNGPAYISRNSSNEWWYLDGLRVTEEEVRALGKMK